MKRLIRYFNYSTLFVFCQVALLAVGFSAPVYAINTNDFYFEDFTADYYISRTAEGKSKMHVHEKLTAVFPDTNQNHGITRFLPYTAAGGDVVTIPSFSALNLKVTRNGNPEPIAKHEKEAGAYVFNIGSASTYVHSRQVYDIEYDFENVILSYDKNASVTFSPQDADHQELYWDTNGTGWAQKFNSLTANVHFVDKDIAENLSSDTSCYVGRRGEKGSERCKTTKISDGFQFTTSNLAARENLTLDISLPAGTFITEPTYNYLFLIIFLILAVLTAFVFYRVLKSRAAVKDKITFYKESPVPPQYTPMKGLEVAAVELVYMKAVKSSQVAILIDLAVRHKVKLIKGEKKLFGGFNWSIEAVDVENLTRAEKSVLEVLNAGTTPRNGETIEVKNQNYNSVIAAIKTEAAVSVKKSLEKDGFFEKKEPKNLTGAALVFLVIGGFVVLVVGTSLFADNITFDEGIVFGGMPLILMNLILVLTLIFVPSSISSNTKKYKDRTKKGLEASIYLDGLKLYMEMAEKDRLKVLQSVKGADTSPKGIVKLYEKLLPYALLFGIEESWMKELNHYYETADVASPVWYAGTGPIIFSDFRALTSSVNHSITSATISSSSSSSGSSGGGGGGCSGGGGGGGGGGGW